MIYVETTRSRYPYMTELIGTHRVARQLLEPHAAKGRSILEIGGQRWQIKKWFPFANIKEVDIDKRWKPDYICDAEELSKKIKEKFDIVFSQHFFEHVYKPEHVMQECNRILKKNGLLIFIVPVVHPDRLFLDGDEFNTHQHYFTKKNMTNLLTKAGFKPVSIKVILWIRGFGWAGNFLNKGDMIIEARKIKS